MAGEAADVDDFNDKKVAGEGGLTGLRDANGACQVVAAGEVDVLDVVCGVVVFDLAAGPIEGLCAKAEEGES